MTRSVHLLSGSTGLVCGLGIFILSWCLPAVSLAAVSFSEVAWMGDSASANHEWIELYNSGQAVVVDGWEISDGANLHIALAGTVPAGAHVVLERTSDESASGTAFLIYTGGLVNTGAMLSLKRADGSIEDQIAGGANWENIGGDNVTKETAQYTTKGWITASPTPGRDITSEEVEKADEDVVVSGTSGQDGKVAKPVVKEEVVRLLLLPDISLRLKISGQGIGYVNQVIPFQAEASGIGDGLLDSLVYEWNFGDGMTAGGLSTTHTFSYPGTYVVTLYASYKRQQQAVRQEITVLPVSMKLTRNITGDVQVNSDSPYDLDISGYRLVGHKTFVFPPRTIILPKQTITIPLARVGGVLPISLYDSSGAFVTDTDIIRTGQEAAPPAVAPLLVPEEPIISTIDIAPVIPGDIETIVSNDTATETPPLTPLLPPKMQQAAVGAGAEDTEEWPYYALAGVMTLGVVGILLSPARH